MKRFLQLFVCLAIVAGLFGCSTSRVSDDAASNSAVNVSASQAQTDTAASGSAASSQSTASSGSATPAPSETPSTGDLSTAPLLAGVGLIALGSAGLVMLKRI